MQGQTIGPYQILQKLSSGGMGVVYEAEDTRLHRRVAVKFLEKPDQEGTSGSARFLREARAASALNHPNICTIHDVGEHQGRPFIVMELLKGRTLSDRLKEGPLPIEEVRRISLAIAQGLEAAHALGIIHRDIKPLNIFLSQHGVVKILDFGIAKKLEESPIDSADTAVTQPMQVVGSVHYMSPEQVLGREVDTRSDLFSLGVVIYEMIAARRPFEDTTRTAIMNAVINRIPSPLPELRPGIDGRWEVLVRGLMEKDAAARIGSAAEVIRALENLREPGPTTGPLAPAEEPAESPASRIPRAAILAGGLVVLALALGLLLPRIGLFGLFEQGPGQVRVAEMEQRPVVAVLPLANLSGNDSLTPVSLGISHSLITSLSTIPSVTMIAPSSTLTFSGDALAAQKLVRELGAGYVVTGSLQESGGKLFATLNLERDQVVVWGGEAEADRDHLFDLQKELAGQLSGALRLAMTDADKKRLETPPTLNNDALTEYLQARAFLERPDVEGNVDRAIELLESAVERDSRFALGFAALGEAFWVKYDRTREANWTARAREMSERAIELDPDQPGVHYSLALILRGTGQAEQAVEELGKAIALQPSNDDAHRLLAEILVEQGAFDNGVLEFKKAIELRPNFWRNHRALGLAFMSQGKFPEAIESLKRVTELQPDLSWGYQTLGLAYHSMGRLDDAEANYEKAINLGGSAGAYSNLGTLLYRQEKFSEAAENYREAIRLRPNLPSLHRNLGDTFSRMKNTADAEAAYVRALELTREELKVNPNHGPTLAFLALVEAKLDRFSEAFIHIEEGVKAAPGDAQVLFRKAAILAMAGEKSEALAILQQALKLGYSADEAREDDDLTPLREMPEFQNLVSDQR